jgi:hypothetical protein
MQLLDAEAQRQRRHRGDQQEARAQTLQHVAGDEHRRVLRRRRQHRSDHQQGDVEEHHPPLPQQLRELHGHHRPGRVGGIRHARADAHRLRADVQIAADDRGDRSDCRRQRQIWDEGEHHHRGGGRIAACEWTLSHRFPFLRTCSKMEATSTT